MSKPEYTAPNREESYTERSHAPLEESGKYGKNYLGSDEYPIHLPEVTAWGQRIYPWYVNLANNFFRDDPIFGDRRIKLVGKYYNSNNPFRQGNDLLGNAIIDTATAAGIGGATYKAGLMLMQNALKTAPKLAAAIAGGYAGAKGVDAATEAYTGRSWADLMANAGGNEFTQATTNPGGWVGSYVGSRLADAPYNAVAWFRNQTPQLTITPEGAVELLPGESTVANNSRSVPMQYATQGTSRYQDHYTEGPSGAKGSSAGQKNYSYSTKGTKNVNNTRGYRVMGDVQSSKNGVGGFDTYDFKWTPYMQGMPLMFPMGNTHTPTILPPVTPEPDYRYEQYTPMDDAFLNWFGKQRRGTRQYYEGDETHPAGWYTIEEGGKDLNRTKRDVGNKEGYIARDSSTVSSAYHPEETNKLTGGIDPSAVILPTKLKGF